MADQTTPRTALLVPLAWAAIAVGLVWLMEIGGVYGIYIPVARLISVALTAAAIGAWAVAAARSPGWRPRSAIWPALALPLAAFTISTLFSQRPRISVEYLGYTVLLVALYLLLRALLAHPAFRDRVAGLAAPLAVLLGVAYLAASVGHWIDWWGVVGAFRLPPLRPLSESLTYGNPSAVMAGSVLLTTAAVAHLGVGTKGRRIAVAGLVLLAGAVTLMSGSRGGWLGVGVAVVVVAGAGLASPPGRRAGARLLRARAARAGVAVAVIAAVGASVVLAPWVLQRAGAGGEDLRLGYVAVAGRLFADAPITGVGAGVWVADRIATTTSTETDYYIPHAHNIYAQTAAEHGLLGIIAGVVAIACLAWLILGGLRDPSPARRRWAWATLFGTVYFGAHQLLDLYADFPAILFAFALPVAWLDATAPRSLTVDLVRRRMDTRMRGQLSRSVTALAMIAVTVSTLGLLAQEIPALAMDRGWYAAEGGNWTAALPELRAANDEDPAMPAYTFARGLAEARAGDPTQALDAFERVAATDDLPVAWLDVAALRAAAGDASGAGEALNSALRLGAQQPAILFAAGYLAEQAGDTAAADARYAATLQALPSLAGDPWWQDPARTDRWPAIRDTALAGMNPEFAVDLWLSSGDATQAAAAAAQIPDPTARERTQLAIAAWAGTVEARATLDEFARDHPFDMAAVTWAGRAAARAGDDAALRRYRLWAETVQGGGSGLIREIRVAPAGAAVGPSGLSGMFWGQYTYRRPTPSDQLVPGLPHLVGTP